MIREKYDDERRHVHILSYGGGTQSTAMLLMSLEGKIFNVKPDFVIFADTGWEPKYVYDYVDLIDGYIQSKYDKKIIRTTAGNIREDTISGIEKNERFASMPFYTKNNNGEMGMVRRQCTNEYKIQPVNRKIKELLGYSSRERVKEVVHIWKGISIDEIQRVKPATLKWQIAEHPLVDLEIDRQYCIDYVKSLGLPKPQQSSCIGCPFHSDGLWREIKLNDPESFEDAVKFDRAIRNQPRLDSKAYLHKSAKPLEQVDFNEDQLDFSDYFDNECTGFCGV